MDGMMQQMMAQQTQVASMAASQPRVLATGDLLIPMNAMSGEFPVAFPSLFSEHNISEQSYRAFIGELNSVTMGSYQQSQQAESDDGQHDGRRGSVGDA